VDDVDSQGFFKALAVITHNLRLPFRLSSVLCRNVVNNSNFMGATPGKRDYGMRQKATASEQSVNPATYS
jgi:hypothetical protein